jgi:ParB family chromosome partitioning protein
MPTDKQYYNSIFWLEVERIKPNPFQPRKEFDELALKSLAESIRQYGVLQPLTVTKKEYEKPGEGITVEYELIAGERRLRASKIAGLLQVPCLIRTTQDTDVMKLEMAIIENLQREDLNPVDRAKAFRELSDKFGLKHVDIGLKVGKSREYVSNTLRILNLPEEMLNALTAGEIVEGHTRPLLMLADRPEEQKTLFHEITAKRLNVRDSEQIARRIALERARKTDLTPELMLLERELSDKLGTRVRIEKGGNGQGKVLIEFFSVDDLASIRKKISDPSQEALAATPKIAAAAPAVEIAATPAPELLDAPQTEIAENPEVAPQAEAPKVAEAAMEAPEDDLYSLKNFTV